MYNFKITINILLAKVFVLFMYNIFIMLEWNYKWQVTSFVLCLHVEMSSFNK